MKFLFMSLYFVQGAAISYFSLFQKNLLIYHQIERSQIAILSSLLLLPFIIKIFFGMLSDRLSWGKWGGRKPFMLLGLLFAAISFFSAAFVDIHSNFLIYACAMLLASFSISFFDAATDGLAVDIVEEEDQGSIQSFMVGGKSIAVILFSTIIGLATLESFQQVFLLLAILFLLMFIYIGLTTFPRKEIIEGDNHITRFWKDPLFQILALFAVCYSFVSFGIDGLVPLFFKQSLHFSQEMIGYYGSLRGVGAIAGAFSCGLLIKKHSLKVISFFILSLYFIVPMTIFTFSNEITFYYIAILWGTLWGMQEVIFLTLCMHVMKKYQSAFGFAALMAFGNVGTGISEGVITYLTQIISYAAIYILLSAVTLIPGLVLILFWSKSKKNRSA